ncbi:FAD-binding protein [Marinomonas sp. A79]|uniref:FAD-binding protein n=1 Tax=Marinomonas vulgaris TaxID=2823372 RepID=A0ABS5H7G3_9GAMM|nr:FAD-binding protein [Marinomonas vulgaris]MBR7887651.1 FAD-binding protein [Marinomonas vulgaris]
MSILLLAEVTESGLAVDATARAVTAARQLDEVTLLCAGGSIVDAAAQAAKIDGVSKVIIAEDAALAHRMAEPTTALILSLAEGYTHIVAPATSDAKNILPRVAALLDVMVISDVIQIDSADTFQRPIYAGNAIQTVKSTDAVKVLTIRTSVFEPADMNNAAAIETVDVPALPNMSTWIEDKVEASKGPELSSAKVVVSAGRAIGSTENFGIISALANKLDAAVGASRAAVDAGYAPNDWQVGQTGKVVAPNLYLACGISGAIQHLAGMKGSKVIVAINTDPDAPIFQVADYGLVGDLFDVVPQLTEQL